MGRIFGEYIELEKGYTNKLTDSFLFSLRDNFKFVKLMIKK